MKALSFKVLSMFAALALLAPVFLVPAVAAQAQEKDEWKCEVRYLDAEVRMIEGQPVLVVETEKGYVHIPFELPGHLHGADGQRVALEMQGNSIVLPTEDGPVAVPIEEFCVVMVDGQVALLAEVNPYWHALLVILQSWAHQAVVPVSTLARIVSSRGWSVIHVLDKAVDPSKVCLDAAAAGIYKHCRPGCDCRR